MKTKEYEHDFIRKTFKDYGYSTLELNDSGRNYQYLNGIISFIAAKGNKTFLIIHKKSFSKADLKFINKWKGEVHLIRGKSDALKLMYEFNNTEPMRHPFENEKQEISKIEKEVDMSYFDTKSREGIIVKHRQIIWACMLRKNVVHSTIAKHYKNKWSRAAIYHAEKVVNNLIETRDYEYYPIIKKMFNKFKIEL